MQDLRQKSPQRDGGCIDVVFVLSEGDPVPVEHLFDFVFRQDIGKRQPLGLQEGSTNETKLL